jgi:hypothetical protein
MMPFTVHRSAREKWTARSVHFGGREFRCVRFPNGARVTWAVTAHKPASPSRFSGTLISRRHVHS